MKKLIKENKIINKLAILGSTLCATFIFIQNKVYATSNAASNTESIDGFITFACEWLTKIGGVIALVGRCYVCFGVATRGR